MAVEMMPLCSEGRLLFALALARLVELANTRLSDRPEPDRPKRPLPAPDIPVPEFVACCGVEGAEP
jgi:hypothetical protein